MFFLCSNAFRQVYEIHVVSCVVVKSAVLGGHLSVVLSHHEMRSRTLAVLNYDNIHDVFRGLYYCMVGFQC